MLKLKKNVIEVIKPLIRDEKLEGVIEYIEDIANNESSTFSVEFSDIDAKRRFKMEFTDKDFAEELVPYKWYERELFDGNPKGYWLVERDKWVGDCGEEYITASTEDLTTLKESTTHFMYIKNVWG